MRVLLTGSSGWLGRFLVPMLRGAGHSVTGLDVAPGANTAFVGSVADPGTVERAFALHAFDAVVHAGALHKPDIARHPVQAFIDMNVTGTLNLLQAVFTFEGKGVAIRSSIGIALCPEDARTLQDLLRCADQALYAAKQAGRGRFRFFKKDWP